MDLIKTGLGLTQTIKNMARFREIVGVFAKNGFDEFIIKTGLHTRIPDFVLPKSRIQKALGEYDEESWGETLGYRLRSSFEELGPSFVKLGQLLATREDIFPEAFVSEMKRLQDKVRGIPFLEAKKVIENSLGKPWESIFSKINEQPVGTASIGVAYVGALQSGEEVVIKVRRPNILQNIRTDFSLLKVLVTQLEKVSREIRSLGLSRLIKDFSSSIETELDFRIEALNCRRLKGVIERADGESVFYLPKVYEEFSTDQILVMEYLEGIPFTDTGRIVLHKEQLQPKLEHGLRVFIHTLLLDGFFHADLHGGNFLLLKDHRIGIVDFGLVGTLSKRTRSNLVAILYSLVTYNYENLVYEFLDVAEYESIPDIDELIRDVKASLAPYVGLTVQQVDLSLLFRTIMGTLTRHQIYLPREWFIVFRGLVALDGVGRSLNMDFDLYAVVEKDIRSIIKDMMSKEALLEEALWAGRDVMGFARSLPRHLKWFLKEFARRNYAFEVVHKGRDKHVKALTSALKFLGFSILAGFFIFSGAFLLKGSNTSLTSLPALVLVLWAMAVVLFGAGWFVARK